MSNSPPLHPYLTSSQVDNLNEKLAKSISADFASEIKRGRELLVIVTLKGAVFFAADLVRKLTIPVKIDFVRLASYGAGTKSSGTVRILKDLETSPHGKHVLILDEIVDTGRTLSFLIDRVKVTSPLSIRVGALLSKPSRREIPVAVDYVGLEVPDKFLVGYGLDFGERYRNLKDISYLEG